MIGSLGWGEILVLAILGLIIFGPDRLPHAIREARDTIRGLVDAARRAREELQAELGPEMADLDLRSLHPRRLVTDAIFGDDDELLPRRPRRLSDWLDDDPPPAPGRFTAAEPLPPGESPPYDIDAT